MGLNSEFTYDIVRHHGVAHDAHGTTRFTRGVSGASNENHWIEVTDPVGGRERLEEVRIYDALRRVTAVRDPEGRTVVQEWCDCGSLDKLIDANGNVTSWERDLQGRVIKETRANGSFKTFDYESTSNRLARINDAKGQTTQYTYALDDKLLFTEHFYSEHPTPDVYLSYSDPQTQVLDPHGRLREMTDGTGTTTYTYHAITGSASPGAGQLASVDGPLTNDTISYTYDELGRVKTRALNGVTTTWVYDLQGRLTTLQDPIGNFTWAYVGNTGRVQTVTYPNNQTSAYARSDPAGAGGRVEGSSG